MRWAWSCLWWFLTLTLPSPGCEAVLKYTTPSSEEKLERELSACIISDYSNRSVDLFWFPLWSTRCFGSPTSTKYFNSILKTCDQYVWNVQWGQWKGTPCYCYISSIFITSCWWWWFWLIWGSYHHLNTLITHMRLDTVCLESSVGWLSWSIRSLYWLGLKDEVHARKSLGSLQLPQQLGSTFLVVTSLVKTRGVSR